MQNKSNLPEALGGRPDLRRVIPTPGSVRAPRGRVMLGDRILPGWESFEVVNNVYQEADTFRIEYAASAMPADYGPAWLMQQTELYAEIITGVEPHDDLGFLLIYGRVDNINYDPVEGTVTLTGRDLTGAFIDTKATGEYVNQRASDIVTAIATAHGLYPDVTPTKGAVGTFYQIDQVKLAPAAGSSEWDLLCSLARQYGFVVYVKYNVLYFGPDPRDSSPPYVIQWCRSSSGGPPQANVSTLSFSHDMTIARGISVTVKSTRLTHVTPASASYPTTPKGIAPGKSSPYGAVTNYEYHLPPGHSISDCMAYAQQLYRRICQHAMKVEGEMPGDEMLSVAAPLKVTGTGTACDQSYYVMSITRSMSMEDGYLMRFEAQNLTPDLETVEA